MTASVTLHDTTSDWTGATGTSRLPDYAVGDLLVMVYAFAGASSVSIDDGSWTELYQDQLGTTAYTAAGGTGDHCWFYGSACIAVWYKIATDSNTGPDINGPGVTPSTGNLSGAGVTYAFRHSDPATWPTPPIIAGDPDWVDASQITLGAYNAGAHNTVTAPGVTATSGLNYFMFVQAVHAQGTGAIHPSAGSPPSLGMTQITDAQDFPIVSEGSGTNNTEGIEFQTWRRIGDGSGGASGSIGPLEGWFGRVDLNQFGDFAGEYYLIPGGARAFVILAEPTDVVVCDNGIGGPFVDHATTDTVVSEGVDVPVQMPANVQAGDYLVAFMGNIHFNPVDPSISRIPPGWNQVFSSASDYKWYKVADGTEGGTTVDFPITSTFSPPGLRRVFVATVLQYRFLSSPTSITVVAANLNFGSPSSGADAVSGTYGAFASGSYETRVYGLIGGANDASFVNYPLPGQTWTNATARSSVSQTAVDGLTDTQSLITADKIDLTSSAERVNLTLPASGFEGVGGDIFGVRFIFDGPQCEALLAAYWGILASTALPL